MLIVCNGMYRSGSTLQYNLVRGLLDRTGLGEAKGYIIPGQLPKMQDQFVQWGEAKKYYAIKTHRIIPDSAKMAAAGLIKICYTYRDIRDVACSAQTLEGKRNISRVFGGLDRTTETYFEMKKIPGVFSQRYEDWVMNIPEAVRNLANYLGLNITEDIVTDLAEDWSLEKTKERIEKFGKERSFQLGIIRQYRLLTRRLRFKKIDQLVKSVKAIIESVNPKIQLTRTTEVDNLLYYNHISDKNGMVGRWQTELQPHEVNAIVERYNSYLVDAGYLSA